MRDLSHIEDPPAAKECPYCLARMDKRAPPPSTEIVFLNTSDAGYRGTVVDAHLNVGSVDRFLVRMEYEPREGVLRSVSLVYDQYLDVRFYKVPKWMPPVSVEDNAAIHEQLLGQIRNLFLADERSDLCHALQDLVWICWWRRLPIDGMVLWQLLAAHGVQASLKFDAIELVDFGLSLLHRSNGRAPIKRKAMAPMSQGCYLTAAQRTMNTRMFGRP